MEFFFDLKRLEVLFANAGWYCVRILLGPALLMSSEYDDIHIKIYLITMLVHVDWYLLVYK